MKKTCLVLAGIIAVAFLVQTSAQAQELKKISLDDASSIGLTIQNDAGIETEGKASIKITTAWPTTWFCRRNP
jgi:hypothetical protein